MKKENNQLFPIFLKLENLKVLVIGGGNIGAEKLHALLQNSAGAAITVVAKEIGEQVRFLAETHRNVTLIRKAYDTSDLDGADLVIAAVNDRQISEQISNDARLKRKPVNVADKPALCDFYLGSVVKKGNLKIAISTNGKSPTIAKRMKEVFTDLLPDELDLVLENLHLIRNQLKGDFASKVSTLNKLTEGLVTVNNKII